MAVQSGLVAVLGPNGAGKTTLLRCLATVIQPSDGRILVDGLDPRNEAERIEIRRRLGYLPQELGGGAGAKAFDVLDYIAVLKGMRDDRLRRRAVFDSLDRVGLADRAGDRLHDLSAGMRRRLGVAQAILGSPTLLVLDEPAAGLDPDERFRLREIVAARRTNATTLISTHLTDEAAVCDSVMVLSGGSVRFVGTPQRLASVAQGRTWVQPELPPPTVRASWRLADGRYRCLGVAPPHAGLIEPTLEDGYLLIQPRPGEAA